MKPNTNPTFNAFVTEMNRDVFDGLVVGGTKEMKVRLQMGDIVQVDGQYFVCATMGWERL